MQPLSGKMRSNPKGIYPISVLNYKAPEFTDFGALGLTSLWHRIRGSYIPLKDGERAGWRGLGSIQAPAHRALGKSRVLCTNQLLSLERDGVVLGSLWISQVHESAFIIIKVPICDFSPLH